MLEGIPWQAFGIGGAGWFMFTVAGVALIRGELVPRKTMDDAIHDRDEWRSESRLKDAQLAEKDEQLRHMAEVGRTVDQIMRSMQSRAGGKP